MYCGFGYVFLGVAPPLSISTHHPMHPSSLTESPHLRPRPVFTAPPPPDTPPPPEVMTSDDLQKDNGSAVDLGVTDSSTQVHVNTRNSLSSGKEYIVVNTQVLMPVELMHSHIVFQGIGKMILQVRFLGCF